MLIVLKILDPNFSILGQSSFLNRATGFIEKETLKIKEEDLRTKKVSKTFSRKNAKVFFEKSIQKTQIKVIKIKKSNKPID